ncbi:uncharacterized protein [Aristolochia californica]|uniref:uncharacterized protein n=1 Tax=Aristolochia californica TaxID=171875 RepID=UPI0035E38FA0
MKEYYDQGHQDVQYNLGEVVWLRLQPYHQKSIAGRRHKLSPKYFGPFTILQSIGLVAYKLHLPLDSKLHIAFHVSLLMSFKGPAPPPAPFLPPVKEGAVVPTPSMILGARRHKNGWEVLVQWTNIDATEASWEDVDVFQQAYPTFELEDKLYHQGGRDVVDSIAGRVIQRQHR